MSEADSRATMGSAEPIFNWSRLYPRGLQDLLATHGSQTSASLPTVTCADLNPRLLALGTSAGAVHLFDILTQRSAVSGGEDKLNHRKIPLHAQRSNAVSIDAYEGSWVASAAEDGSVVCFNVAQPSKDRSVHMHHRAVKGVQLAPDFARHRDRPLITGGKSGKLHLLKKKANTATLLLGALSGGSMAERVIHEGGEGQIGEGAIAWRGALVAWANEAGVKVVDVEREEPVCFIPAASFAPPSSSSSTSSSLSLDITPCRLVWESDSTLLVAWGSEVRVVTVSLKKIPTAAVAAGAGASISVPTNAPGAAGAAAAPSIAPSLANNSSSSNISNSSGPSYTLKRTGDITCSLSRPGSVVVGVAPFGEDMLALLCYSLAPSAAPAPAGAVAASLQQQPPQLRVRLELQILARTSAGQASSEGPSSAKSHNKASAAAPLYREELSSAHGLAVPVPMPVPASSADGHVPKTRPCLPSELHLLSHSEGLCGHEGLPFLFVVTPLDVVVGMPRGPGDHAEWQYAQKHYGEAVAIALANPLQVSADRKRAFVHAFIGQLFDESKGMGMGKVADACVALLGDDAEIFNHWIATALADEGGSLGVEGKWCFARVALLRHGIDLQAHPHTTTQADNGGSCASRAPLLLGTETKKAKRLPKLSRDNCTRVLEFLCRNDAFGCDCPKELVERGSTHSAFLAALRAVCGLEGPAMTAPAPSSSFAFDITSLHGVVERELAAAAAAVVRNDGDGGVASAVAPRLCSLLEAFLDLTLLQGRPLEAMAFCLGEGSHTAAAVGKALASAPATHAFQKRNDRLFAVIEGHKLFRALLRPNLEQERAQEAATDGWDVVTSSSPSSPSSSSSHLSRIPKLYALDQARALHLISSHLDAGKEGFWPVEPWLMGLLAESDNHAQRADEDVALAILEHLLEAREDRYNPGNDGISGGDHSDASSELISIQELHNAHLELLAAKNKRAGLMRFLQRSLHYSPDLAESLCKAAKPEPYYHELAFLLSKAGKLREAVTLQLTKLKDMGAAVNTITLFAPASSSASVSDGALAGRQQSSNTINELWSLLLQLALKQATEERDGSMVSVLLDHVGVGPLDPLKVIEALPKGVPIPDLHLRLASVVKDKRLHEEMVAICASQCREDIMALLTRLADGRKAGIAIDPTTVASASTTSKGGKASGGGADAKEVVCALCMEPLSKPRTVTSSSAGNSGSNSGDGAGDSPQYGDGDGEAPDDELAAADEEARLAAKEAEEQEKEDAGKSLIFFCRHSYHFPCLKAYHKKAMQLLAEQQAAAAAAQGRPRSRSRSGSFGVGAGNLRRRSRGSSAVGAGLLGAMMARESAAASASNPMEEFASPTATQGRTRRRSNSVLGSGGPAANLFGISTPLYSSASSSSLARDARSNDGEDSTDESSHGRRSAGHHGNGGSSTTIGGLKSSQWSCPLCNSAAGTSSVAADGPSSNSNNEQIH